MRYLKSEKEPCRCYHMQRFRGEAVEVKLGRILRLLVEWRRSVKKSLHVGVALLLFLLLFLPRLNYQGQISRGKMSASSLPLFPSLRLLESYRL